MFWGWLPSPLCNPGSDVSSSYCMLLFLGKCQEQFLSSLPCPELSFPAASSCTPYHIHFLSEIPSPDVPLLASLKAETHDATNRYDTSPWQVAATNRLVWLVKIIVAATEFCRCDLSHKFKLVWICATYRSDKLSVSDFSLRCVAAICRIVCLGLYTDPT